MTFMYFNIIAFTLYHSTLHNNILYLTMFNNFNIVSFYKIETEKKEDRRKIDNKDNFLSPQVEQTFPLF